MPPQRPCGGHHAHARRRVQELLKSLYKRGGCRHCIAVQCWTAFRPILRSVKNEQVLVNTEAAKQRKAAHAWDPAGFDHHRYGIIWYNSM